MTYSVRMTGRFLSQLEDILSQAPAEFDTPEAPRMVLELIAMALDDIAKCPNNDLIDGMASEILGADVRRADVARSQVLYWTNESTKEVILFELREQTPDDWL